MTVFCARARERPYAVTQVKLGPQHASDFTDTLSGNQAKLEDALAIGLPPQRRWQHVPEVRYFSIAQNAIAATRGGGRGRALCRIAIEITARNRPVQHSADIAEHAIGLDGPAATHDL